MFACSFFDSVNKSCTQVTLAVLQKFLYFTMAIVGTIGFQLKAGAASMS